MNKQNRAAEFTLSDSEVNRLINAAASIRDRLILKTLAQTGLARCFYPIEQRDGLRYGRSIIS